MDRPSINGFSIIEIFITILIISITLLVITFFFKNSIRNYASAYYTENAYIIAEDKLSELSAVPFPVDGIDQRQLDNQTFDRTWTVTVQEPLRQAKVTVSWILMGKTQQVVLTGALR